MKTVKLWSSTLLRGHKSMNLSVWTATKLLFSCMRARRWHLIYLWSGLAWSFIHQFWSVLITSFRLRQINWVWGSLQFCSQASRLVHKIIGRWSNSLLSQLSQSFPLSFASTGFVPSNCLLQEQVLFILYFKTWPICIVEDRDSEICVEK